MPSGANYVLIFTSKREFLKEKEHLMERQKPSQALKEALRSQFPKYGNSVKVVTYSGAHGDAHHDPSVKAISRKPSEQPIWPPARRPGCCV